MEEKKFDPRKAPGPGPERALWMELVASTMAGTEVEELDGGFRAGDVSVPSAGPWPVETRWGSLDWAAKCLKRAHENAPSREAWKGLTTALQEALSALVTRNGVVVWPDLLPVLDPGTVCRVLVERGAVDWELERRAVAAVRGSRKPKRSR